MKKLIVLIPFFAMSLFMVSCNQSAPKVTNTGTSAPKMVEAVYKCPMDTDVVSNKPGECPKCGMDLEKVTK